MRADKFFAQKYGSRAKASQAIINGEVLVNEKTIKPSSEIKDGDLIAYVAPTETFVSNGGVKLSRAIHTFNIDVNGLIFADIGASTGGFSDCLLQNGVKRIYDVDVGESLLDERLKGDERVIPMENTNARYLTASNFPERLDGAVIDVSFISLSLILPVLYDIVSENGIILALIKPQFECENKKLLSKSGIVTDKKLRRKIVEKIYDACVDNHLFPQNIVNAPLRERKNVEYVIFLQKNATKYLDKKSIGDKADALI